MRVPAKYRKYVRPYQLLDRSVKELEGLRYAANFGKESYLLSGGDDPLFLTPYNELLEAIAYFIAQKEQQS